MPPQLVEETSEEATEEVVEEQAPSPPPPSPPETVQALFYRLGQLEERQARYEAALAAMTQVAEHQEQEIAATEQQLEMQEEALSSVQEDDQEECQQEHPPLWCRLLGGQRKH